MDDFQALAAYVYELHKQLALILQGADIAELCDAWYRPRQKLGAYFDLIEELRQRFGVTDEGELLTTARDTGRSPYEEAAALARQREQKGEKP